MVLGVTLTKQLDPKDLYIHGKVGRAFCAVSFYVSVPVDIAMLPVTVPVGWYLEKTSDKGMAVVACPGIYFQSGAYVLGACIAYPGYIVAEDLPERIRLSRLKEAELPEYLWKKFPYLSASEYQQMIVLFNRTNAPGYKRADSPDGFTKIGMKPQLNYQVVRDWESWKTTKAGQ